MYVEFTVSQTMEHFLACHEHAFKAFGFCVVTLDCEDDGCLLLHQLPTPEEANVIRDILGIHKRREVSAAELERLKAFAFAKKPPCGASLEQNIALSDCQLPDSRPGSNADFIPASAPAARA
jgi:hypothetical protein